MSQNGAPLSFQQFVNLNYRKPKDWIWCGWFFYEESRNEKHKINLANTMDAARKKMYPFVSKAESCVVMLLTNLVQLEWMTVSCYNSLTKGVLCSTEGNQTEGNGQDLNRINIFANKTKESPGSNLFKCKHQILILSKYSCNKLNNSDEISQEEYRNCCPNLQPAPHTFQFLRQSTDDCEDVKYIPFRTLCSGYANLFRREIFIQDKNNLNITVFTCFSGKIISHSLTNDLIPDCGPSAEDEELLNLILSGTEYFKCKMKSHLPCKEGHPKCYNKSQSCIYRLDDLGHLSTCRNGKHLESCKSFQCKFMYKCTDYYCIPWSYVCDGKIDCPKGDDEDNNIVCGSGPHCVNMFKCIETGHICLHVENVCDGIFDCPWKDDEDMCDLKFVICMSFCY